MTEPNLTYSNGITPTILVGGKAWPIPPLAIKQQRVVYPAIMGHYLPWLDRFMAAQRTIRDGIEAKDDSVVVAGRAEASALYAELTGSLMDTVLGAIYMALTRAHPTLTRAEFDDMSLSISELVSAMNVVITQSGMFQALPPGTSLGEAKAQESAPPSTGTA